MGLTLAFVALALIGFAFLGGLALLFSKLFNVPLFGTMLLPVKLLFMIVLGFCVAFTANGLAARFAGFDLREHIEEFGNR